MRLLFTSAALGWLIAGQAAAQPYRATSVEVRNAAALLTVVPEDRSDVEAVVARGARLPAPSVALQGDQLIIDGGVRVQGCGGWFQLGPRSSVRVAGFGVVAPDALQRITLHVPRRLNLSVGGGVHSTIGASDGGRVQLSGCGRTDMADAQGSLDLSLSGSGDVHGAAVGGALHATLNGSGDVAFLHTGGQALLRLTGSGDLSVGDIDGALDAQVQGSGDVRAGAAAGAELALNGSGDVSVGDVRGALSARLDGSGDIAVHSAQSPSVNLELRSSGDVDVRGGHAGALSVINTGSGDVRFNGRADVSRLSVAGSGDVSVADAGRIEMMRDSGSGGIHVGK